jgi:hypothetical protein
LSRRAEKLCKVRKWRLKKQLRPRFLKRRSFDPRTARHFVEAIAFVVLVMSVVTAGAQERRSAPENDGKRSSELAKDNLDRVAASETQIAGLLSANPGLLVELKRWMAKDASDKGQIVQDEDLEDAAIMTGRDACDYHIELW